MSLFKKPLILIAVLLFALSLKANSSVNDANIKLIRKSVIGYNHGVMKAAKTGNPDTLLHLTAREQYLKTTIWIKSWHDATVYMDARIDTIDFKKIERIENRATAETDEKWFYTYKMIKDKSVVYPEKEIDYKIRYSLIYEKERWLIENIEILDEKTEIDDPKILIRPIKEANKRPYSIEN